MMFFIVGMSVGAVINWVLNFIPSTYRPPYSCVLFLLGAAAANLAAEASNTDHFNWLSTSTQSSFFVEMIHVADDLHPHLVLYILLPPLLFHASSSINWHVFKKIFWQAFMLAGPGVVISCILTALVPKFIFMHSSEHPWDWSSSLLLGAILSATDPVAVVNALNSAGAPEKLCAVIEGEALLNDGSAYVLFSIVLGFVSKNQGSPSLSKITFQFVRLAIFGPLVGLAFGILITVWLMLINHDVVTEVTVLVLGTFPVFAVAQQLEVSSVLATVVLGLVHSARGKFHLSADALQSVHNIYAALNHWANTMLFLLSGIVAFKSLIITGLYTDRMIWYNLCEMYFCLHLIRGITVFVMYKLGLKRMGYGLDWRDIIFVVFSGLRGAIALVLALLVQLEPGIDNRTKHRIGFHTAGIVALTLMINGTLSSTVYTLLSTDKKSDSSTSLFRKAMEDVEKKTKTFSDQLRRETQHIALLSDTCWICVSKLVPDLKNTRLQVKPYRKRNVSRVLKECQHGGDEQLLLEESEDNLSLNVREMGNSSCDCKHNDPITVSAKMTGTQEERTVVLSRMVKAKYNQLFKEGRISQFVIGYLIGASTKGEELWIMENNQEHAVIDAFRKSLETLVSQIPIPKKMQNMFFHFIPSCSLC